MNYTYDNVQQQLRRASVSKNYICAACFHNLGEQFVLTLTDILDPSHCNASDDNFIR